MISQVSRYISAVGELRATGEAAAAGIAGEVSSAITAQAGETVDQWRPDLLTSTSKVLGEVLLP
jgi:hypothetical protein